MRAKFNWLMVKIISSKNILKDKLTKFKNKFDIRYMLTPIIDPEEKMKEKLKREEIEKELSEIAKIDENATYYGVGKVISVANDPVSYINSYQLFCEIEFLNWILNFIAKGMHYITFRDIMPCDYILAFIRGNPSAISYTAFILVIIVFYITYKIIEKICIYFSETPDPFLIKIGVIIFLGLLLAMLITYISLNHDTVDNFLNKHFIKIESHTLLIDETNKKTVYDHMQYLYVIVINMYFFKEPLLLKFSLSVISKLAFYYLIFMLFFVTTKLGHSPTLSYIVGYEKKGKTLFDDRKSPVTDFLKYRKQINNMSPIMYPKLLNQ